jgi:hypothetical protein
MASVIMMVHAHIDPGREAAFNAWYDANHAPKMGRIDGVVNARRFKRLVGETHYEYLALYEFASIESFREFSNSERMTELVAEYDESFGADGERVRAAYVQIWPS